MRLFLDVATRVFRGVAPDGDALLGEVLTANAFAYQVSDDDWTTIYYPAWLSAQTAQQDLVIHEDGSTLNVAHVPTHQESVATTLRTFAGISSPTTADLTVALKALAGVVTPSYGWAASAWGDGVWGAGA